MADLPKVEVYEAQPGSWLSVVGEDDALDLTKPMRVVRERDYSKLETELAESRKVVEGYEIAHVFQAHAIQTAEAKCKRIADIARRLAVRSGFAAEALKELDKELEVKHGG